MYRNLLFRNLTSAILVAVIMVCSVSVVNAVTLTYDFNLNTPHGAPMTQIVLYAAGEGQDDVYLSPVELPARGAFQLTHTVDFEPTAAFVLGLSLEGISPRDGLPRWHLMTFTNNAFAADAFGRFFSDLFPSEFAPHLDRRLRHSEPVLLLQAAHSGDPNTLDIDTTTRRLSLGSTNSNANSLDLLTDFIRGPDATAAYFDPDGSFRIIAWSVAVPADINIPEPSTLALAALSLLSLGITRRRRRR